MFSITSLCGADVSRVDAAMAIISDSHGNPIAVIQSMGSATQITTADQPDFQNTLKALKIDRTVIVSKYKPKE